MNRTGQHTNGTLSQAHSWVLGTLIITALLVAGCGGNGMPLVAVSGKVTFDGNQPPAPGSIAFQPLEMEAGLPKRPGRAKFDESGQYQVSSYTENDGLLPGKYRVVVTCDNGQPDPNSPTPFEDITMIGPNYEPKEVTIERDSSPVTLDLDVPRKK